MLIVAVSTATLIFSISFSVFSSSLISHPSAPIMPLVNSGNNASEGDDWPMFHADPSHSGVANSNPVLTPTLIWKYTTGNSIASSPAVSNGVVYIGSDDKNLYAINATNGDKLWNYTIGGSILSSPANADGVVYVGGDNNIYALSAVNGSKLWSYNTGGYVGSSSAIVNGVLYIAGGNSIYSLGASSPTSFNNQYLLVLATVAVVIIALTFLLVFRRKILKTIH
jgi:PQQ-like domain